MTNQNQRNILETRISDYARFMKICPKGKVVALAKEITKLQARVCIIRMMEPHRLRENVDFYFETKQSKLNFKTLETPDMSTKKRNTPENCKPIHDQAKDSRNRALQLASEHKDIRPIKYLLKR